MKSINKGKPALVSAANSDIGKKLAGGMHQFLSDEAPTPKDGTVGAEAGDSRGFWRRKKKTGTDRVPELETA